MINYAEIHPETDEVLRVVVLDLETLLDNDGNEIDQRGVDYLTWLCGGAWIRTWEDGSVRGRFAAPGMFYHTDLDIFIEPQPHPSWTIDNAGECQPPNPMPNGGGWHWEEAHLSWYLNINQADVVALDILHGVGVTLASEIINERNASGPFTNIQEVADRVSGIGSSTVDGWSNAFVEPA